MAKFFCSIGAGILTGIITAVIIFGSLTLLGVVDPSIITTCWNWFIG